MTAPGLGRVGVRERLSAAREVLEELKKEVTSELALKKKKKKNGKQALQS